MKTDTKVCIGATIAIVAALLIAAIVFHIDIGYGLTGVGFVFLIGLPTYIVYRKRESEERNATDNERHMQIQRCLEVIEEIQEYLDGSIAGFQQWGKLIKGWEKEDEKAYYAEVALMREAGINAGGLSAEMGEDVSYLIKIQRLLSHVESDLRQA